MIYLVNFADSSMTISQAKNAESSLRFGVDRDLKYSNKHLPKFFVDTNSDILSQERGCGFWLWKPFIIMDALNNLNEGDILIYSDAGVEFINNVSHIIERMDQDIFFFGNNYNHVDWCKADINNLIIPEWKDGRYDNTKQVQASVIFFKVCHNSKDFVRRWLAFCQMPGLIDDSPSVSANAPTFRENRHDQSILTALQIKHGFKTHYWAAIYNDGAFQYDKLNDYRRDNYPVIFHHHRKRNNEW